MNKTVFLALLPPYGDCSIAPLGIPCIAAGLRKRRYRVIKRDYNVGVYGHVVAPNERRFADLANLMDEGAYDESILPLLRPFLLEWTEEIIESGAGTIGFTCFVTNVLTVMKISEMIKARDPGRIIVAGGPEVSRKPDMLAGGAIDFAVRGDGEKTFPLLLQEIRAARPDFNRIKGIYYLNRKTDRVEYTGDGVMIELDTLPYPDFTGIDFNNYKSPDVPLEASRGCINRCSYCGDAPLMKRFRFKSGRRVFKEVMRFVKSGYKYFSFMDSLINGNIKELETFCDLIIKRGVNRNGNRIFWGGNACVRKEMTAELLHKMKTAGCTYLTYGVESGSDSVLEMMNKKTTAALIAGVLRNTHRAAVKTQINMLLGFPTEKERDFKQTLDFIAANAGYIDTIFAGGGCVISQNSDMEKNPRKYGIYWKKDYRQDKQKPVEYYQNWYAKGSSPETRRGRVVKFVNFCRSLDINVQSQL
jgi:anaerobic magnesium-protoporphyrin IX monomethyl ester cyclase